MKQIQFAILNLTEGNPASVRAAVEGPLNNGWELNDWKPVGITKDEQNNSAVSLVVCLTRELADDAGPEPVSTDEEPAVKRGRPAKVVEEEVA